MLQTVPHLAIWDDHDFGWNDCVGSQLDAGQLAETRALSDKRLGSALNNNRPHLYCSHDIGSVGVLTLDGRAHRSLSTDAAQTVLGGPQEAWLWNQLRDNPKPYTIVCSGSGIARGAQRERLNSYPAFVRRLRSELRWRPDAQKPRKVLFLSGDIHDNSRKRWTGFYEVTSSGVACLAPSTQGNAEVDNWGLIEFDLTQGVMHVDLNGHAPSFVGRHTVRLSDWTKVT